MKVRDERVSLMNEVRGPFRKGFGVIAYIYQILGGIRMIKVAFLPRDACNLMR